MTPTLLLLATTAAFAQDSASGVDGHGFRVAPIDRDIRDPILVQRPGTFHQGDVFLGTLFERADRPLVDVDGARLDDLFVLDTSFGVAVHDRVRLAALLPYYASGVTPDGPIDTSFGDLRLEVMGSILRPEHLLEGGGPGVGVTAWLDLPTGRSDLGLGDPGVGGGFSASATEEYGVATVSAEAGIAVRPAVEGVTSFNGGASGVLGAAASVLYTSFTAVHAEIKAMPPFATSDVVGRGTLAEAVLSHRLVPHEGFHFVAGAGFGLTDAPGSPYWRVFGGLGAANLIRPRRDADPIGAIDVRDKCPLEAEVINGWLDDDGCADELASLAVSVIADGRALTGAAVTVTGPQGETTFTSGVSPYAIPSAVPGTRWSARATAGPCLEGSAEVEVKSGGTELIVPLSRFEGTVRVEVVDATGMFLPDATAEWASGAPACLPTQTMWRIPVGTSTGPVGTGTHRVVVKAPGYTLADLPVSVSTGRETVVRAVLEPTLVRVEARQIVIMDKVHFETAKTTIKPESYGLLDAVAAVIVQNPQVGRVEVAGHTDNQGSDEFNLTLSQGRAEAVRTYLAAHGVDAARLLAKGYGETVPIDTNATKDGRAANRRVEFNLVDQAGGS